VTFTKTFDVLISFQSDFVERMMNITPSLIDQQIKCRLPETKTEPIKSLLLLMISDLIYFLKWTASVEFSGKSVEIRPKCLRILHHSYKSMNRDFSQ